MISLKTWAILTEINISVSNECLKASVRGIDLLELNIIIVRPIETHPQHTHTHTNLLLRFLPSHCLVVVEKCHILYTSQAVFDVWHELIANETGEHNAISESKQRKKKIGIIFHFVWKIQKTELHALASFPGVLLSNI